MVGLRFGLLRAAPRRNSVGVPLVHDEGDDAYAARLLECGRRSCQHSLLQKPPGAGYALRVVAVQREWPL